MLCDGVPRRRMQGCVSCLSPPDGFISIMGFLFCTVLLAFQCYFGFSRKKLQAFCLSTSCEAQEGGCARSRCAGLSTGTASGVGNISDISLYRAPRPQAWSVSLQEVGLSHDKLFIVWQLVLTWEYGLGQRFLGCLPAPCPGTPGPWSVLLALL